MNMESRQNASSTINIYLHFPRCFHKYNYRPYLLSYNDAMQSEFVKTLLENEPPEEECPMMKNVNYTIPFSLYKNVRGVDLHYFMKCWMGEESITAFRIDNSSDKFRNTIRPISKHRRLRYAAPSSQHGLILNCEYSHLPG